MIKSVNFRSGTMLAALANLTRKSYLPSRNRSDIEYLPSPPVPRFSQGEATPTIARNRQRWSRERGLTTPLGAGCLERPPAVNPSQWLATGNPRLASLVTETIGDRWLTHPEDLQQLATVATNPLFQLRWRAIKQANKRLLANILYASQGIRVNVNSLFDLQLDPIGGHQRQLLNLLHIMTLVDRLKQNPYLDFSPRTWIFADLATAAAVESLSANSDRPLAISDEIQYDRIKQQMEADSNRAIVGLIQALAATVAANPLLSEKLQIVYIPAAAELTNQLYAAADLTEQIATAAIEDLDLGKLQAVVNGVLSIGSLGKTNHWLQQTVGERNCFRFGLAIPEIALFKEYGYDPYNYYKYYSQIRSTIDCLLAGYYTPNDPSLCRSIIDTLLGEDEHMVLADYIFYAACQAHVSDTYRQTALWTQMSIMNVAGIE